MRMDQMTDLPLPVSKAGRYKKLSFSTFLHSYKTQVPTFDHSTRTENKLKWFPLIMGRIKLCSVFKVPSVVSDQESTFNGLFAGAYNNVGDFKFFHALMIVQGEVYSEG
jgi:hypothetical protein